MPKIAIPHAGDYYVAFEHLFTKLGYDYVMPPTSTKKTLDIATKYTPSQSCLPFKLLMGNLFEAVDHSVTRIGMTAGRTGMCRQAYMGELFKKILNDHGFNVEVIPLKLNSEMWQIVKNDFPHLRFRNVLKYFYEFWLKIRLVELLREQCLIYRPQELVKGSSSKLYYYYIMEIRKTQTITQIRRLKKDILNAFSKLPQNKDKPYVNVAVVGEFFLMIDQFSTSNLEVILGEQGAKLSFCEPLSAFLLGSFKQIRFLDHFLPTERNRINKLAKPYINRPIGGHALQTIGHAIDFMNKGAEGILMLYPFTCMPEIAANAILPGICKSRKVPLLTICFDEQTGVEGLKTRLEAFVDLIYRRKKNN